MLNIYILPSRCELEELKMPFGGNKNNHRHPVIVRTKRTKRPVVELALKCPKDKPCQLAGSDSEASTDYGSITSLLNHDVSCYTTKIAVIIETLSYISLVEIWNISNISLLITFSVGIPAYNKGKFNRWKNPYSKIKIWNVHVLLITFCFDVEHLINVHIINLVSCFKYYDNLFHPKCYL